MIFARFHARPGRVKRLEIEQPRHGPGMIVIGIVLAIVLGWSWSHPGDASGPRVSLTPGGVPVPPPLTPDETPEQTLARHLRAVPRNAVERLELVLEPDWLEKGRLGVDQVRVLALLYTGSETVSSTGSFAYAWTRGDERPTTGHGNLQAATFHRGKVEGFGKEVVYKEVLRIDTPQEKWTGLPIRVEITFDERRTASASMVLEP